MCFTYNCVSKKDMKFCGECADSLCDDIINRENPIILDKSWLKWKKDSEDIDRG